jgi:hypothetical protein
MKLCRRSTASPSRLLQRTRDWRVGWVRRSPRTLRGERGSVPRNRTGKAEKRGMSVWLWVGAEWNSAGILSATSGSSIKRGKAAGQSLTCAPSALDMKTYSH